jgi:peptidylprolyl isomerase
MIKEGDIVSISYIGKLENDKVFDSTEEKGILTLKVGEGKILKGIEESLISMKEGETKDIVLPPDKSFGTFRDDLQIKVSRDVIDKVKKDVLKGDIVEMTDKDSKTMKGIVIAMDEKTVTLDMNHPLAGRTVTYSVTIESIEQ